MQTEDEKLAELERRSEIEWAKLGVAEDLGWGLATFAALAVYLKSGAWYWVIAAFVATYYLATYPYRRCEKAATDLYARASKTGKYSRSPQSTE